MCIALGTLEDCRAINCHQNIETPGLKLLFLSLISLSNSLEAESGGGLLPFREDYFTPEDAAGASGSIPKDEITSDVSGAEEDVPPAAAAKSTSGKVIHASVHTLGYTGTMTLQTSEAHGLGLLETSIVLPWVPNLSRPFSRLQLLP